jgi:DsbC/DsbD-like thiol-disulfide interchange protein
MRADFRALPFALALLLSAATARAEGTPIPHGTLELIADKQWLPVGGAIDAGLHFQLEKGWHIYWVNPGDSGEPPRVSWQLPSGITAGAIEFGAHEAGKIEWPIPRRFQTSSSIVDYGYVDAVLLIVPLYVDASVAAQATAHIGADVKLLICSHEMCVPGKAQLSLTLPVKSQAAVADARNADLFTATRKSLPRPAPANWKLSVTEAKDSFVLSVNGPQIAQQIGDQTKNQHIAQAVFFPLVESQIENSAEQKLLPQANGFRLTLRKSDQLLKPITRLRGVLAIADDRNRDDKNQGYLIDVSISKR